MRPAYDLESYYRVTILTTERWTREGGTPPAVKSLLCYTDGSRTLVGGYAAGVCRQYLGRRFSSSLRRFATNF